MAFVDTLGKLVGAVSGAMSDGTVPALIGIGQDLIKLVQQSKEVVASEDIPALEKMLDELTPVVLAHAEQTEKTLRG
jgi:hypothetical protein